MPGIVQSDTIKPDTPGMKISSNTMLRMSGFHRVIVQTSSPRFRVARSLHGFGS